MSVNLSGSSFAVCLAAGLKVPRQYMYCSDNKATDSTHPNNNQIVVLDASRQGCNGDLKSENSLQQHQQRSLIGSSKARCNSSVLSDTLKVFPDSSTGAENDHFMITNSSENFKNDITSTLPDIIQQPYKDEECGSGTRAFRCLTCFKAFRQKATLIQHERIHTDLRPFGCAECGKHFRQQSHLTQHIRIHANEKPFRCSFCDKTFRQRAILNQHVRIHSGEKPFVCNVCGKHFRQKAILSQHIRIHQDFGSQLIVKNASSQTNWSLPAVVEMSSYATNGADSTTCNSTENNTMTKDLIIPKIDQDDSRNNSPSSSTNSYLKSSLNYAKHSKVINLPDILLHNNDNRMASTFIRCPICQKEFRQKSTLLQHGCIHIESRPYPCPECDKRFRQQSHLTQHLRIHTNEKPYGCIYCGRQFRQKTILNQHVRIHTGEKPYRCLQCPKEFRQKAILDQHTRTHQSERPFCCPMPACRRRFINETEVKKHIDHHMSPNYNRSRSRKPRAQPSATVTNHAHSSIAAPNPNINNPNVNNQIPSSNANTNSNFSSSNSFSNIATSMIGANFLQQTAAVAAANSFFKPEMYFSQCYGPPFAAHSQNNLNSAAAVQMISEIGDFAKHNLSAAANAGRSENVANSVSGSNSAIT